MNSTLRVKDDLGKVRQLSIGQAKHEASALLLKGKPEASLLLLAKAVQFAPRDPEIRFLLGESEVRTGGLESGVYHLKKAVEIDANNADYHIALCRAAVSIWHAIGYAKKPYFSAHARLLIPIV